MPHAHILLFQRLTLTNANGLGKHPFRRKTRKRTVDQRFPGRARAHGRSPVTVRFVAIAGVLSALAMSGCANGPATHQGSAAWWSRFVESAPAETPLVRLVAGTTPSPSSRDATRNRILTGAEPA